MLCPNDCSGHGSCNHTSGVCECLQGFTGANCSALVCPGDCSGHGLCDSVTGDCHCGDGWHGPDCGTEDDQPVPCPDNCSGFGTCDPTSGVCACMKGHHGDNCAQKDCPEGCEGHGDCNENTGVCECNDGYTGEACADHTCPRGCHGHGECSAEAGACQCDSGFTSSACDHYEGVTLETSVKKLDSFENAVFVDIRSRPNTHFANDTVGLFAIDSECDSDVMSCAVMVHVVGASDRLRFKPETLANGTYEFRLYSILADVSVLQATSEGIEVTIIPEVECVNNCNEHGVCTDGVCVCDEGYLAPDCSGCKDDCNSRGQCVDAVCQCDGGWKGDACETAWCVDPECGGHGTCVNAKCECDTPWSGESCESSDPCQDKVCPLYGACDAATGECVCNDGYQKDGEACIPVTDIVMEVKGVTSQQKVLYVPVRGDIRDKDKIVIFGTTEDFDGPHTKDTGCSAIVKRGQKMVQLPLPEQPGDYEVHYMRGSQTLLKDKMTVMTTVGRQTILLTVTQTDPKSPVLAKVREQLSAAAHVPTTDIVVKKTTRNFREITIVMEIRGDPEQAKAVIETLQNPKEQSRLSISSVNYVAAACNDGCVHGVCDGEVCLCDDGWSGPSCAGGDDVSPSPLRLPDVPFLEGQTGQYVLYGVAGFAVACVVVVVIRRQRKKRRGLRYTEVSTPGGASSSGILGSKFKMEAEIEPLFRGELDSESGGGAFTDRDNEIHPL
eukprot:GFYU01014049.1.p1 GENE.GFYU01014049.1~~GFYU01014049.1.p1  ORF type:complete len:779 (-),score=186.60 GFYU01014049.1:160-2331(-)